MGKVKTCIFISGNGSNLKNLILKSRDYNFPIRIKLVITNNRDAYGLYHAKKILYHLFASTQKRDILKIKFFII